MSMKLRCVNSPIPAILLSLVLSGCATGKGPASYVPPEALSYPSAEVSDALLTFGARVQSQTLADYRRAAREDMLRGAIRDYLTAGVLTHKAFSALMPAQRDVLCLPRYGYLRISTPVVATNGKATAVKELVKPASDDIKTLIKALGEKYTIDVTTAPLAVSYDTWMATGSGISCAKAVETADPFATRDYIGREFALSSALVGFKTLFETVWGLAKPVVTGALQNVDTERRNRAVRDFFSDDSNIAALKSDVEHIETFLRREFILEQRKTAGAAVAAQAAVLDPDSAHWRDAAAIVEKSKCAASISRLVATKTDPAGVACLRTVYGALDPAITLALDEADRFDASMEKELPESRLSEQIDTVSEIAQGKMPADDRLRAMWGVLIRYATLYDTVRDLNSEAQKEKWDEALEAFRKALN